MSLLDDMSTPIIAAPMAGGPSTPEMVSEAGRAGGLGFLASGTISAEQLARDMREVAAPRYGVNLFCPQQPYRDLGPLEALVDGLVPLFARHGLPTPELPAVDYTMGWDAKVAVLLDAARAGHGPAVVSSTFGIFSPHEVDCLHSYGVEAWVTVTNEHDAAVAARAGVDALVVQGPEAGGHRSTWTVVEEPDTRPLRELVAAVHAAASATPLVAAGGLSTPETVAEALSWPGVRAVSCGTAFLLAEEAGTSAANRALLARAREETVSTRAFSGRYARGLATAFTREYREIPPSYPHLNVLLKPMRSDPECAYCLAGQAYREAKPLPAADIMELLGNLTGNVR
ncbi:nitronate monooxygenase [Corynebacterium sp. zg-331]|uniref:NAD(P)H-dependent flavin oxidoreductase n=1 Tax=unclassified Corynebacterium TaxID=2624378 RepID=UPI00128DAF9E|nr:MULTISPECIES: nitronate monooxygenase [unclassified Corynebacterium]MBC3186798.1 nitronate monooxygenase [Corynebacterium sp. zg-331]MPV53279.1 nitronate monooxygenase [Corynebacterium sp. zg331]